MDENFAMGYAMGQDNNGSNNDGWFGGGSGGWLNHEDGSAQFLISRPGIYMVSVGAQVTSDTAATDATLAITVNGEALAGTTMAQTITAAADVGQLATTALLTVPCGASVTVGLANTGDTEITINAASLVLTRVA